MKGLRRNGAAMKNKSWYYNNYYTSMFEPLKRPDLARHKKAPRSRDALSTPKIKLVHTESR
jgi:hypothetical protein